MLTNAFPTGAPEALADSFFDLAFDGAVARDYFEPWNALYASLFGPAIAAAKETFSHRPEPATLARPSTDYIGTYANDYIGEGIVTAEEGVLTLALGPDGKTRYPLTHFDRDTFLTYPSPEMPDMPSTVAFTLGPDGEATAVTVESLADNGFGTLTRVD